MVPVHAMTATQTAASIPTRFREAGATEPGRAIAFTPPDKTQDMLFRRLVERGALVEMRPGSWYLNEEKLAASSGGAGVVVTLLLGVAALAGGMMLVLRAG